MAETTRWAINIFLTDLGKSDHIVAGEVDSNPSSELSAIRRSGEREEAVSVTLPQKESVIAAIRQAINDCKLVTDRY